MAHLLVGHRLHHGVPCSGRHRGLLMMDDLRALSPLLVLAAGLCALALAGAFAGCGDPGSAVDSTTEEVIGGVPIPEGASPTVRVKTETGRCSGVMLLPDVAITAGHCGSAVFVQGVAVAEVVVHPDFDFPQDDLALLLLSEPLPYPVAILGRAVVGPAWVEGYSTGQLEAGQVELEAIRDRILLTTPGTTDACKGDSGGGLYQGTDLVGITSFGRTDVCGSGGGYVPIYRYTSWIEKTVGPVRKRTYPVAHAPHGCSSGGNEKGRGIVLVGLLLSLVWFVRRLRA